MAVTLAIIINVVAIAEKKYNRSVGLMAVVPFATLLMNRPQVGRRPIAEAVFASLLTVAAIYTGLNEGGTNWQSLWTCAIYLLFAVTLWQARVAQSPK